jgi:tripartite-type tricarboxylate transporter receptor subunit TctC
MPKGTSKEIAAKVHAATVGALKDPAVSEKLTAQLYEPIGNSPEEFAAFIRSENEKWGKLIKQIGLRID